MSTDTIFTAPNSQVTPEQPSQPIQNDFTTILSQIKNDMGQPKYKDTTEALNGLKHAQEYIPQLKGELSQKDRELETLRNEVLRLKTVEETVARLTERQQEPEIHQSQAPVYDDNKIAELINQTLSRKEIETTQRANLQSVVASLQQSFGEKAEEVFYGKAAELGMSKADVNKLASQSPQAVLQLMGMKGAAPLQEKRIAPSGVNTAAFQQTAETKISRNTKALSVGATTSEMMVENRNSKDMVSELHAQGLTMRDLADPKIYNKYFN
jgi:hypothetical protein